MKFLKRTLATFLATTLLSISALAATPSLSEYSYVAATEIDDDIEFYSEGIEFSSNGDELYVISGGKDSIFQYKLTSPYDLSTADFYYEYPISAQDAVPSSIAISNDGGKMFILGNSGDDVNEYALLNAYDISTAIFVDSFAVDSQDFNPGALAFSNDGQKMYVVGTFEEKVFEYDLATMFDVSTATYNKSFDISAEEGIASGLHFDETGTSMFLTGYQSDQVYKYELSTPYDVSTAVLSESYDLGTYGINSAGLTFSSDMSSMFVLDSLLATTIHEFSLETNIPKTADINGNGEVNVVDVQCAIQYSFYESGASSEFPACIDTSKPLESYDLNCDDSFNIADVQLVIAVSLNPASDEELLSCE